MLRKLTEQLTNRSTNQLTDGHFQYWSGDFEGRRLWKKCEGGLLTKLKEFTPVHFINNYNI